MSTYLNVTHTDLLTDPMRVTMVRTVVTPIPTLAGAEALSRKKLTQDMITIRLDGT